MRTSEEIVSTLSSHKDEVRRLFNVKRIGVFGSYARDEQNRKSDVDILVDFDKPIGLAFVELAEYLEQILKIRVDVVSRKAIAPKLLKSIEEDIRYV